MIRLYSPENEVELSIVRSIFEAENIQYYIHNDHFGTMKTGPKIELLNKKTICVPKADFEVAKEILNDFLESIGSEEETFVSEYSVPDKIRMIIEALIFGWFMPGKKWNRNESE